MAGSLWVGTFLAEVEAIAATGKFTEPDGAIAEGEEVIGDMTVGERALYTFHEKAMPILRDTAADLYSSVIKTGQMDKTLNARGAKLSSQLHAANEVMWQSIRDRLYVDGSIGVRKGYQIVKTPDQPAEDRPRVAILDLGILHFPGLR